jgi:hypothetical protein
MAGSLKAKERVGELAEPDQSQNAILQIVVTAAFVVQIFQSRFWVSARAV